MRRYAVLVVGILVALGCARLGLWQLDRLSQRRAQNRLYQTRLELPVLALPSAIDSLPLDSLGWRRVVAHGVYDFEREVVVVGRSVQGTPAVYVVTPLILAGGRGVLVERGWVYSPDARAVELSALRESDTAEVEGVLLQPALSRRFEIANSSWPVFVPSDDPAVLAPLYPYPLLEVVLRRTGPAGGSAGELRPISLPELSEGPHLSYAVQWFSFAVIALVGSAILYRRTSPRRGSDA
ncbi:putative SURF1-like protein [bacterium HR33]|nr:putative SURF1-like protein [bacterium HR33]